MAVRRQHTPVGEHDQVERAAALAVDRRLLRSAPRPATVLRVRHVEVRLRRAHPGQHPAAAKRQYPHLAERQPRQDGRDDAVLLPRLAAVRRAHDPPRPGPSVGPPVHGHEYRAVAEIDDPPCRSGALQQHPRRLPRVPVVARRGRVDALVGRGEAQPLVLAVRVVVLEPGRALLQRREYPPEAIGDQRAVRDLADDAPVPRIGVRSDMRVPHLPAVGRAHHRRARRGVPVLGVAPPQRLAEYDDQVAVRQQQHHVDWAAE